MKDISKIPGYMEYLIQASSAIIDAPGRGDREHWMAIIQEVNVN